MNPIRRIRRIAAVVASLATACLGVAIAAPAAFAMPLPPSQLAGGKPAHSAAQVQTVVAGGMAGWQIALIAIGAALIAATAAVLLDRARRARRLVPAGA
ncbi:MAG TPA: hypothetical protein VGI64_11205 [Streptosporangiaceae bacterium]